MSSANTPTRIVALQNRSHWQPTVPETKPQKKSKRQSQSSNLFEAQEEEHRVIELPRATITAPHGAREKRWYQEEALAQIRQGFLVDHHKALLLEIPTGGGKTFCASLWVNECLGRQEPVLILTNRDILLEQMQDDLAEEGVFPLVEKAEQHALPSFPRFGNCVLASVQTLHKKRLETWPRDAFRWIISDECHYAASASWRRIVDHFSMAGHLGLTATPERTDGNSLKKYFHHPYIRPISLREAVEQDYLAPFVLKQIETDIDLRKVGIVGADFDQRELDRIIWENTAFLATKIVAHMVKDDGTLRPAVVFTPHVNSAEAIAAAIRDLGIPASAISYRSNDPASIHRRFRNGELLVLTSVAVLAEGFNAPWVELIALACPSLNIGPLKQKVGRGTRKSPATGKENCLILEFLCETNDKHLASVIDIVLGDREAPDAKTKAGKERLQKVRQRTEELVRTREDLDVIKAAQEAEQQVDKEIKEEIERRKEARRAKYKKVNKATRERTINPFVQRIIGTPMPPQQLHFDRMHMRPNPASEWQLKEIAEMSKGRVKTDGMTAAEADKTIKTMKMRRRLHMATEPQIDYMVNSLGCDPRVASGMKVWEAADWISEAVGGKKKGE